MYIKRTPLVLLVCLALILVLSACQPIQPLTDETMTEDSSKIANAMSAAPLAISEEATILDWPSDMNAPPPVLREGSNEWACLPDNVDTPGNDPMCVDPVWMAWMEAFMAGAEPENSVPGISYMLAGGSDASNTDPYAMEPAEGDEWVESPAHIMLLVPGGFDPAEFSTDPDSGGPYIMWEGTPYEHLMIPVDPAG